MKQSMIKDVIAVLMSLFFIVFGFGAIWFSKNRLGLQDDTLFIILLLAPIISYAIFSGRLSEFKAGGLEAKFVDIAKESVDIESEKVEVEDTQVIQKGSVRGFTDRLKDIDKSKPIILTLYFDRGGYYDRRALLEYLDELFNYPSFKFAVVLRDDYFVAYIRPWEIRELLNSPGLGDEFVETINVSDERKLKKYPGVVVKAISTQTSNLEALREMTSRNLDSLVVVDKDNKFKGVVEREQILSKLFIGMAS